MPDTGSSLDFGQCQMQGFQKCLLHYIYVWSKREKVSGFAYYFITQFKSKLFRNVLVYNE